MRHHYHRIHPRLRGVHGLSPRDFPAGTLAPAQILTAYGFKQNQFAGASPIKLGIGSLGGGVVQQDIDNSVQAWGMAAPKLTVRTIGGAVNDPTSDQDSNVENMLDIVPTMAFAWWWLTGTPADITITFGPNANGGMQAVTSDLVAAGVQVASWSWGSAADTWDPSERAALSKVFAAAVASGICFCAAAGDNSIDDGTTTPCTDYPCSDPNVWAVGGTHLSLAADGSRASESAWGDGNPGDEGGGGGYDPTVPVPSWQAGVVPTDAPGRGVPDTAANADPNSGWQMSANGQWTVVGGTSASSPFTAALIAAAIGFAKATGKGLATPSIYAAGENGCFDITTGSNGDPATPGWDPATGLGTPRGANFTDALIAWAKGVAPTPAPTPSPSPTPPAPPPASPASVTLAQAQAWATQGVNTGGFFMTRTQAAARASSGLAENWPSSEET